MKKYSLLLLAALALSISPLLGQTKTESFVLRLDPSMDALVASDAKVELLYSGNPQTDSFEGPTWIHNQSPQFLVFTNVPGNLLYKWAPDGKVTVYLDHIFTGDPSTGHRAPGNRIMIGPNGATLDRQGRLVYTSYSAGQIVRVETDGKRTVLAERYDGKHINAPNDVVVKSDGSVYFTDSRASTERADDPKCGQWWISCGNKDGLPHKGLYFVKDGVVHLFSKDIDHPNGLVFSPDEKYLYVSNSILKNVLRYDMQPDGTGTNEKVLIDMNDVKGDGIPDGIKIDTKGNIYCTGPGGIWIISPAGKHLGTILTPNHTTNFTFGGDDAKMIYMTGVSTLSRFPVKTAGIRP